METWLFFVERNMGSRPIEGTLARMDIDSQKFKWLVTAANRHAVHEVVYNRIKAWGTTAYGCDYSTPSAYLYAVKQSYNLTKLLGGIDEEMIIGAPPQEEEPGVDPVPAVRRLVDRRYAHLFDR